MLRKLPARIRRAVILGISLLIGVAAPSSVAFPGILNVEAAPFASPSTSYVSGITVQNLSSNSNPVTIQFFDSSGNLVSAATINVTLSPLAQQTWYTPTQTSLPAGFAGSAVVSGQYPVAAIFNTQTPSSTGTSTSDPIRLDTGVGADPNQTGMVGTPLYLPQVMRNYSGFYTTLYIQNASDCSSGSSTTVTVAYRDRSGNPIGTNDSATIAPCQSVTFNQQNNSSLGTLLGSAVVTSTNNVPLAGVVNIFNADTDNTNAQLMTYNGTTAGGQLLFAPRVVNNYYGFNSGITIQNLDPTNTASVTINFYFPGSSPTATLSIGPQAAAALYLPSMKDSSGRSLPAGVGSAVITSNTNITAIVNEDNRVSASFVGQAATYRAFVSGSQITSSVFMPQITSCFYGYASGMTVQNVGTTDGNGTITLTDRSGSSQTFQTGDIPAKSTKVFFAPNLWTAGNFNGSAKITFSQPIVAIADISFRGNNNPCSNPSSQGGVAGAYGDSYSSYNAINQ